MNLKFTNGRHSYRGLRNSRSQRKASKIYKGIRVDTKELEEALTRIAKEYGIRTNA